MWRVKHVGHVVIVLLFVFKIYMYHIHILFFLNFTVHMGSFPMGNMGCVLPREGKPVVSYPTFLFSSVVPMGVFPWEIWVAPPLTTTHNNGKDLLTNRKDPSAESKDIKGLLLKNQFPRT